MNFIQLYRNVSNCIKLAFSYGLAQSVKLAGFEVRIQKVVDTTKHIPYTLAKTGKIGISSKEVRKMIGKLFIEKNYINLHLNFLDMPKFFWGHTELEPIHVTVTEYMDKDNRLEINNPIV